MEKVFILELNFPYEGTKIISVHATEESADRAYKEISEDDALYVYYGVSSYKVEA